MLFSTTLTANCESEIGPALQSVVAHVDKCLVVDTGVTDGTLDVAGSIAGDKLIVEKFAWKNDFGAARNFALQRASALGATWALTVDTDERMQFDGVDIRAVLASRRDLLVWLVQDQKGDYAKERFIRVPTSLRWSGPAHEGLFGYSAEQVAIMPGVSFFELQKGPEQQRRKLERSLASVTRAKKKDPSNPRWHFYQGWNLEGLERWDKAIECYSARSRLGGWDEEAAWACFRAAHCCTMIDDYAAGVQFSARGLGILPTMAELAWMASYCNYKARNWRHAIAWARLSVAGGEYEGSRDLASRSGFRFLPGLYEKPFEVMRYSFEALGMATEARVAEQAHGLAKAMRMKTHAQAD